MIVDLQVNLEAEDGAPIAPEALVEGAKSAGLDGVVLLKDGELNPDISSYAEAGEAQGVRVFRGTRVTTNHGLILCIFPSNDVDLSDGWAEMDEDVYDANAVVDAVEERGGITVALRPYDREVAKPMGDHLFSLQGLTACEVHNAAVTDIANDLALEAASNMEMPCVGTSDARGTDGLGTVATLFRTPVTSEAELCEAVRVGDCWPCSFSDKAPAAPRREEKGRRGGRGRGRGGRDRDGAREGGGREGGGRGRGGRGRGRGGRDGGREGGGREGGGRSGGGREGGGRDRGENFGNREGSNRSEVGRDLGEGGNRRRRGGRGRGGGGGGSRRPDGYGNTVTEAPRNVNIDDNAGNRVRTSETRKIAEDIGNRLRPGEASPYRPGQGDDDYPA